MSLLIIQKHFALRVSRDVIYLIRVRKPVGAYPAPKNYPESAESWLFAGIVKGEVLNLKYFKLNLA